MKSSLVDSKQQSEFYKEFSFTDLPFNVVLYFVYCDKENSRVLELYSVKVKKVEGKKYNPKTESTLLYHLKKAMNILVAEQYSILGFTEPVKPFIKKRMWRDGHMVSEHCQYLRTSGKPKKNIPYYGIWDSAYALRLTTEELKEHGEVDFDVENLERVD